MNRQEWLQERRNGIGGSDASAVVGANPYKSNVDLWLEKTGQVTPEDISDKPYVKYGVEAESHLRALFQLDYPQYAVEYNEFKLHRHKEHDFLFATLDGELTDLETGERGVLEIKTTNILASMQHESWKDRIPNNYYCQILHQLLCTGWDFAILKAHLKSDWGGEIRIQTKHYTIRREEVEEDIKILKEKEVEFWAKFVVPGKKPGLILPNI